jgi:hypothetical protein
MAESIDLCSVRARVVGNALYVEEIGNSGNLVAIGLGSADAASDIAGKLNQIFNGFRFQLSESARIAGEYAGKTNSDNRNTRGKLLRIFARCENWSAEDVRANVADVLGITIKQAESEIADVD